MKTSTEKPQAAQSPFNSLPPKKIRDLPRPFLLEQLEKYYNSRPPGGAVECDYSLWECAETGLQFAWPMVPGNAAFYEWLGSFPSYYPGTRWEYGMVRRLLQADHGAGEKLEVLDVGCGKGDFLRGLDAIAPERKFALDLNEPAIEVCRRQGFRAFCGTTETAIQAGVLKAKSFPVVTAFHCLEHVDDPVGLARSLVAMTAPGGRVFVSTPYSPLSVETEWFDVLNHPPHHLTRWNLRAYRRLADLLGVRMRYFVPFCPPIRSALTVFQVLHYGLVPRISRARLLADLVSHAPEMIRLYRRQRERRRNNQGVSADAILVEFRVP